MMTLQQQIAAKFFSKLSESKDLDKEKINQLKKLLAGGKKVNAEDLVKIFALPAGGEKYLE